MLSAPAIAAEKGKATPTPTAKKRAVPTITAVKRAARTPNAVNQRGRGECSPQEHCCEGPHMYLARCMRSKTQGQNSPRQHCKGPKIHHPPCMGSKKGNIENPLHFFFIYCFERTLVGVLPTHTVPGPCQRTLKGVPGEGVQGGARRPPPTLLVASKHRSAALPSQRWWCILGHTQQHQHTLHC